MFNVTFIDISVIYVTAHRCTGGLKKLNLRLGSQRHRHFVGFFNVPVQAPTRDPPFYGYSEKPPHFSRLLRHALGYGGHILDLTPRVPMGADCINTSKVDLKNTFSPSRFTNILVPVLHLSYSALPVGGPGV